ncbi:MAG: serine hydrolase domain-containing protein [Haliea sp.]
MSFIEQLDSCVPDKLTELRLPGASVALIENGALVAARHYGYADVAKGLPLTDDTLFQVASISKSVAAWGIMKLVEREQLDLDKPVDPYLIRWHLPSSKYDTARVTPRLLLTHCAGVSLSGCSGSPYDQHWYTVLDILNGTTPALDLEQERYARAWNLDPAAYNQPVHVMEQPGTGFCYSGGGFTILELLIEDISGQSFTDFMRAEVLDPLGMRDSTFELQANQSSRVAVPYRDTLEPITLYRTNGKAAGGLYATIGDLAAFACAEIEGPAGQPPGRGVLRSASIAAMHHPEAYAERLDDMDIHVGLGHFIMEFQGLKVVQHTGGNPGWRSVFMVVPERKAGFACLINSAGGNDLWIDLSRQWAAALLG